MLEDLRSLWLELGLPAPTLANAIFPDETSCLPSSFGVGHAAQLSIGAAGLAATLLYELRSEHRQQISVARQAAERECSALFTLDGQTPNPWAPLSGLYATADGHVRIHANFDHHRDGILKLLNLSSAHSSDQEAVANKLSHWRAQDFEDVAASENLLVARVRSFTEWDAHPQAKALQQAPLIRLTKTGHSGKSNLPRIKATDRPLHGLRVLELTRILAGPICGRTLAGYGANVLLINSPRLPNISAISDTSRGKRSACLELHNSPDATRLRELIREAHVFVQGYRPGGLEALGFGTTDITDINPSCIYVSLSAYGNTGPWAGRRGFDSLVQTATGFNHAEAAAAGKTKPQPLPVQILDFASGFLMACGAQAALWRQTQEGGSWHVEVSLARTAEWLRQWGQRREGLLVPKAKLQPYLREFPCTHGELRGMPHGAEFSLTPAVWHKPSALPGEDPPIWESPAENP